MSAHLIFINFADLIIFGEVFALRSPFCFRSSPLLLTHRYSSHTSLHPASSVRPLVKARAQVLYPHNAIWKEESGLETLLFLTQFSSKKKSYFCRMCFKFYLYDKNHTCTYTTKYLHCYKLYKCNIYECYALPLNIIILTAFQISPCVLHALLNSHPLI